MFIEFNEAVCRAGHHIRYPSIYVRQDYRHWDRHRKDPMPDRREPAITMPGRRNARPWGQAEGMTPPAQRAYRQAQICFPMLVGQKNAFDGP